MRPIQREKNYSFKAAQEVLSGGTRFSLGSGFSELKAPLQQGGGGGHSHVTDTQTHMDSGSAY